MLRRRGLAVGIPGLHAHLFRHTAAHEWLAASGSESDLMRLMGWKSPQMLRRYGASRADERAREAPRRLGLRDRLEATPAGRPVTEVRPTAAASAEGAAAPRSP